jgi:hypothetical protein
MFKLWPSTDTTGITEMGEVEVPPALIVRRLGPPSDGDGYKVSGQYVFADGNGEPFVVHDWKSTNLWDEDFPTPEELWASEEPQELSVSTRDLNTAEFEQWFLDQLGWEQV